ncbi:hypothetical protein D3C80_724340 [compost metagenome]
MGHSSLDARYAAFEGDGHAVAGIPYRHIYPKFCRQRVANPTGEAAGTVAIDTPNRFLYLVEPDGAATRYGVGIGRDGFAWQRRGYHPLAPAMAEMEAASQNESPPAGA